MWEDESRSHSEALRQEDQKNPQPLGSCQRSRTASGAGSAPSDVPLRGSGAQLTGRLISVPGWSYSLPLPVMPPALPRSQLRASRG